MEPSLAAAFQVHQWPWSEEDVAMQRWLLGLMSCKHEVFGAVAGRTGGERGGGWRRGGQMANEE